MTATNQVSIALIVNVVSFMLTQWLGLSIDNETLTKTIQTLILISTAVWAIVQHRKLANAAGVAGVKGI